MARMNESQRCCTKGGRWDNASTHCFISKNAVCVRRTEQCCLMVEIRRYLLFSSTTTFSSGVVPILFVACRPALPKYTVPAFASRTSL
jgi:hypothetical protein